MNRLSILHPLQVEPFLLKPYFKRNQSAPALCTCLWWAKYFNKPLLLSWSQVSDPLSVPQTARYYSVSQLGKIFETDVCPSEYLIGLRWIQDRASVNPEHFHPPPAPGTPCGGLWVGKLLINTPQGVAGEVAKSRVLTRKRSSQGLCRSWIICTGVPCSSTAVMPPTRALSWHWPFSCNHKTRRSFRTTGRYFNPTTHISSTQVLQRGGFPKLGCMFWDKLQTGAFHFLYLLMNSSEWNHRKDTEIQYCADQLKASGYLSVWWWLKASKGSEILTGINLYSVCYTPSQQGTWSM